VPAAIVSAALSKLFMVSIDFPESNFSTGRHLSPYRIILGMAAKLQF